MNGLVVGLGSEGVNEPVAGITDQVPLTMPSAPSSLPPWGQDPPLCSSTCRT